MFRRNALAGPSARRLIRADLSRFRRFLPFSIGRCGLTGIALVRVLTADDDSEKNRESENHEAESAHLGVLSPGGAGKGVQLKGKQKLPDAAGAEDLMLTDTEIFSR